MALAVELKGITKRFPGVVANDDINLAVAEGEIHAICGENGAGKSTLMKILYGMQPPDSGTIKIRGENVELSSPVQAIDLGIGMVHQHFMLADQLTVLENVILGAEPMRSFGRIDFEAGREHLDEVGRAYGLDINADDLVETLEIGERQRVEIIKVLYRGAEILIPRRAHRGARAPGSRRAVPQHPRTQGQRGHHPVHRPQARRGPRNR